MDDGHPIAANGRTLSVLYNARGRFVFERMAGYPITELRLWGGIISDVELAQLICAGLEGHRIRTKARKAAWTVDEVVDDVIGELDGGDRRTLMRECLTAVEAAFAGIEEPTEGDEAGKASRTD